MRKRHHYWLLAMVFLFSGCVILQSERYTQTVRIPLQDGMEVAFEPRAERGPWEVVAEAVSIPQIITASGDAFAEVIKSFMLPLMGRDTNTIGVVAEYHRFVWWADEPLPPIPVEAEKVKLNSDIVDATFGLEEEEE